MLLGVPGKGAAAGLGDLGRPYRRFQAGTTVDPNLGGLGEGVAKLSSLALERAGSASSWFLIHAYRG